MGLEVLTGGDRELTPAQPEWDEVIAAMGLPISPYVAKAAYVAGVLGQTITAARTCWERPGQPFALAAFALASSAVDLLGHCLGEVSNKARLTAGLRFLETVPTDRGETSPMPIDQLLAVRHFTIHGSVHSADEIRLSEESWGRVMVPLDTAQGIFWAAGRPDDEERFAAFARAPITALRIDGSPEPVFIRDVYRYHTAGDRAPR